MTQEEEIAHLRVENQALREALSPVLEELRVALARIEELEKQKTPPPAFAKANVKKPQAEEQKPRKKRDARHTHGRQRSVPTQIVEHRIVTCPDCDLRLGGISLARIREVIDVPPPPPVEVTHHQNSLSLSRSLEFLRTTTWPSAACVPWSLLVKSAAARAVPRAVRLAWDWLASSAPGWLKDSILSTNVSLS